MTAATPAVPRLLLGTESLLGVSSATRDRMLQVAARFAEPESLAVTFSKAMALGADGVLASPTRTLTPIPTATLTRTPRPSPTPTRVPTKTPTLSACSRQLVVPRLVGMSKNDARRAWEAAGFTGEFKAWPGDPTRVVASQSVHAGSRQSACSEITVG